MLKLEKILKSITADRGNLRLSGQALPIQSDPTGGPNKGQVKGQVTGKEAHVD